MRKISKLVFFSYDSLTIYDGGSSTSSMMGKYCGDSIPPSHVSSSNKVLLVLINRLSDGNGNTYGEFQMEYNPTGKQNTSILNNTDYHIDRWRILVTFFTSRYLYPFFFRKMVKIAYYTTETVIFYQNLLKFFS